MKELTGQKKQKCVMEAKEKRRERLTVLVLLRIQGSYFGMLRWGLCGLLSNSLVEWGRLKPD